jgi:glycosyltransferase involved in cell wall biosynthesis
MSRKKICFVVSSLGTAKVFLINHIKELSIHFDVYLVGKHEEKAISFLNKLELKEIKDIEISRNISLFNDFIALLSLRSYFKKMQFDAVHTVTPKVGLVGILAARLAGVNIRIHIFTGQVWHTKKGFFKTFLKFLDRLIVLNSTHILVDGESQRQFLINNKIVKEKDSFVLGKGSISGVDTNRFMPSEFVKKEVRTELGIKENEVVFMFLGRMNTDKGVHELADAFSRLRKKHNNAFLLFAGGDEENMTPMIIEKVKDEKALIFHGITLAPERLLQACDIFCLPSYREGFGSSVIEASLLQKPIICSDTYGLMETIVEHKTGLRHKSADSDSLFFAMEKLINDKDLRELLGKGGREYVLDNFSAQRISEKWVEFYRKKIFNV